MEDVKIEQLISEMTLAEKIGQLIQLTPGFFGSEFGDVITGPELNIDMEAVDVWQTGSVLNLSGKETLDKLQKTYLEKSRLKIPLLFMNDMIYGYRNVFPIPLALAGSHDNQLLESIGTFLAQEAAADGVHVVFTPMLDVVRDPRWGRVMESPGEDVHTVTEYGQALVNGLQGNLSRDSKIDMRHVAACIKHYAAYGAVEAGREYTAADLSQFSLLNTYLPGYLAAVEAGVKLVMTAFTVVNGMPASVDNWLLSEVLRKQAAFNGVVISDYNALNELITMGYSADDLTAAKASLTAGVDIDMMATIFANGLTKLVKNGAIDTALIDQAVLRVLSLKNDLGLFENPYRGFDNTANEEEFAQLSQRATIESSVLLKNSAAVLPLAQDEHIALLGPFADSRLTLGLWGSINADFSKVKTLKAAFESAHHQFTYAKGYHMYDAKVIGTEMGGQFAKAEAEDPKTNAELAAQALTTATDVDKIVLTIGEDFLQSGEAASKTDLHLAPAQVNLIKELHALGKPMIGVIYSGRPLILTDVEPYFDALLLVWFPGTNGGVAITDMLFGKATPSGKLAMSWPRNVGQIPIHYDSLPTGRPLTVHNTNERFVSKYIDSPNTPLYPFGHGLTYGQDNITCKLLEVTYDTVAAVIVIKCHVTSASLAVEDVLQVYLQQPKHATVILPTQKLVATKRLKQQTQHDLSIKIPLSALAYYDNQGIYHLDGGTYTFNVGLSSANILARGTVDVSC